MKKLPIIIWCLLIIILWSCKKYEEGPKVSFRSAKNVIARDWRIDAYTVDRADSMWVIEGLHLQGKVRFASYSNYSSPDLSIVTYVGDTVYFHEGVWSIENKGKEVSIKLTGYLINGTVQYNTPKLDPNRMPLTPAVWKIIRLKQNEDMWIRKEMNGKQYELKFNAY